MSVLSASESTLTACYLPDDADVVSRDTLAVIYELDVSDRRLVVYLPENDDDQGLGLPAHFYDDASYNAPVPQVLRLGCFHPSVKEAQHLATVEVVNALTAEIAPGVQRMLDELAVGPGGLADWTAAARSIAGELRHRIERRPYRGTEHDFPYEPRTIVDAADLFQAHPELIDQAWAEMDGAQLDRAANQVIKTARDTGCLTDPNGNDYHPDAPVVGVRRWLYEYRARNAGGLEPVEARDWSGLAAHAAAVRDDSTEEELAALASGVEAIARTKGVKLFSTVAYLAGLRDARRAEVRAQLEAEGGRVTALTAQLKPAQVRRRALAVRVLGWGLDSDTDSAVARIAGMSHTAVSGLRSSLHADNADDDDL